MQLPIVPKYGNIIGYADILDDVYFEIEFTIHSLPSSDWANIFQCGTENSERYPGLFIHQERLFVTVTTNDGNSAGGLMGSALSLDTLYRVDVHFTQNYYSVAVNDQPLFDGPKGPHSTTYRVPCYATFPYHKAADITISALSMSSGMLMQSVPGTFREYPHLYYVLNIVRF